MTDLPLPIETDRCRACARTEDLLVEIVNGTKHVLCGGCAILWRERSESLWHRFIAERADLRARAVSRELG